MSELSDYRRMVSDPLEASLRATIAKLRARVAELEADPIPIEREGWARECDWPADGRFAFHDDPGKHEPCYVVMPGGAMLPLNHHDGEGVDVARAHFIVDACNAALAAPPSILRRALQYGYALYGPTHDGPWPVERRREFDRLAEAALSVPFEPISSAPPAKPSGVGE